MFDMRFTGDIKKSCKKYSLIDKLSVHLKSNDLQAVSIHGDKTQGQRQRALKQFKSDVDTMVTTDVAARGLDIKNITLVINFDQPQTYDDYIHRIGRTGRGGETDIAITFVKK